MITAFCQLSVPNGIKLTIGGSEIKQGDGGGLGGTRTPDLSHAKGAFYL